MFLAIDHLTERIAVKLIKKLLGEKEVEAVLHRLERLTQDEARTTATQTLEVVYGLVQNMRMIMDGEGRFFGLSFTHCWTSRALDGKASADGIQKALGTFLFMRIRHRYV